MVMCLAHGNDAAAILPLGPDDRHNILTQHPKGDDPDLAIIAAVIDPIEMRTSEQLRCVVEIQLP
jgi:hypothetical protein